LVALRQTVTASVYSRHPWGNIPTPQKKSYIPPPKKNTYQFFFVFGPRIIHCYKKLIIKLSFNFNNFNSRLPTSSQHHIKYFNPKKAHPCVIPRIFSHHASKSVKAFYLCACLRKKMKQKAFSFWGASPPESLTRGLPLDPAGGRPVSNRNKPIPKHTPFPQYFHPLKIKIYHKATPIKYVKHSPFPVHFPSISYFPLSS